MKKSTGEKQTASALTPSANFPLATYVISMYTQISPYIHCYECDTHATV